jgi:plasmid maintenance system antidote protein VapI
MIKSEMLTAMIKHYSNGNKARFAQKIGVKPPTINTWLVRNTFDTDVIFSKCEYISAEWLLSGCGEMLNNGEIQPAAPKYEEQIAPHENSNRIPAELITGAQLLAIIKEKDIKIEEMAKTIGRLENQIEVLSKKSVDIVDAEDATCAVAAG